MATRLKEYFPMIREREEVLAEIAKSGMLQTTFDSWTKEQQEEFLNICTGVKGLKLLYDGFFKEVMNPEYVELEDGSIANVEMQKIGYLFPGQRCA